MRLLSYAELPLTSDPRQVFTLDVSIDGVPLHVRVEIRFLSAVSRWVISLWDQASSSLLVSQLPLVVSCGEVNDLLLPFRYLREGKGIGSLFLLPGGEEAADPSRHNLPDFTLLWGDTLTPEEPA